MLFFDPSWMNRPNTQDFKPPMPNRLMQFAFRKVLLDVICRSLLKGLSVEIDGASLRRLREIRGQRCLLLPNHPSEWDPCVMFDLGRMLDENFFFVAAREVFDYEWGIRGWFFQRLGVYSLVRGSNDRASFKTSMEILSRNRGRLVIFVEGEISNQNDSLLPLEPGVIQLAFMALNELYREHGKDVEKLPPLNVCPVSIRYVYDPRGLDKAIEKALRSLEDNVGIGLNQAGKGETTPLSEASRILSRFERLRRIATRVLEGSAAQFGYELDADASMAENVFNLSGFMLTKLEQIVNLPPDGNLSYLDRIRRVRNLVDHLLTHSLPEDASDYQKRLFAHQKMVLMTFYQDFDRVVNFVAIYDGYLHPEMTDERTVEMIRRLEKEVFGEFRLAHPRKGVIHAAGPINLTDHFAEFLGDRRGVIERLTHEVERQIYTGLGAPKPATTV